MKTLLKITLLSILTLSASTFLFGADKEPRLIPAWGAVTDPDGDCQLVSEDGKLKVTIPGSDHALATERGKTNAPRVLQAVDGDFEVTLKVSVAFPVLAESEVTSRRAFQSAGLVLWQDGGNYVRLEHAQMVVGTDTMFFASFELRQAGRFARQGNAGELPLTGTNTWLRLNRQGEKVTAFVSQDGKAWDALQTLRVDFGQKLQIGPTAGHNSSTPVSAVFEELKIARPKQ